MIRTARVDELPVLQQLERDAGVRFRDLDMDVVAQDDPPSIAELTRSHESGGLLVFADETDCPVAYLLVEPLDRHAHIE